jgi:hypothetical protein
MQPAWYFGHAMRDGPGICALLLALGILLPTGAAADEPVFRLEVLTMAPGDALYSRWGHSGLRIRSEDPPMDLVYDYGRFRLELPFLWTYLTGRTMYWLGKRSWEKTRARYEDREGRAIVAQEIAVPPEVAARIAERLREEALPENREFPYDTLDNNCSTRLRDLLDEEVFHGALRRTTEGLPSGVTARDVSGEHLRGQPWQRAVVNLVWGRSWDRPMSVWETMGAPNRFSAALEELGRGAHGFRAPEGVVIGPSVARTDLEYPTYDEPADSDLRWWLLYALAFLLCFLAPALWTAWVPGRWLHGAASLAWSLAAGGAGLVVWVLLLNPSPAYQGNLNAAAFHPLVAAGPWLARRTVGGSRWAERGLALLVIGPLVGLGLLPLVGQRSLEYLAPALLMQWAIWVRARRLASRPSKVDSAPGFDALG